MEPVFALDIGTRTVIGIVGARQNDQFRILAQEMVEHAGRAMYDGQIHDIPQVAAAVRKVKDSLEKKLGAPLEKAAIAAAGRALVTSRITVEQKVNGAEIDENTVRGLELIAVRRAQEELAQKADLKDRYYYVGHSVVTYFLDGFPISNLIGHRAGGIGADALATFLPASVVDSLFSVLARVGLEPQTLTLEPIAAAEVVIPAGLRLLNLALVDIGAGTSDIAVTREGSVIAYGMVPLAGDEVSEAIAEACLVDFPTAEQIKRRLRDGQEIAFTDILGQQEKIAAADLLSRLDPVIERITSEIAAAIINLNAGRPPKSVFCVGGGAQVPGLIDRLTDKLALGPRRVGLKDRAALADLAPLEGDPAAGPEGVTVVGIAVTALKNAGHTFLELKINDQVRRVFNFPGLKVAHALSGLDFTPRQLFARAGKDLKFSLNGREEVIRGELARPAAVLVNGRPASLQTPVQDGDEIVFRPAQNGRDARAAVKDFLSPEMTINVTFNGKKVVLEPVCRLNDLAVDPETEIHDGDHLVIDARHSVQQLAERQGFAGAELRVNGKRVPPGDLLAEGDRVEAGPAALAASAFAASGGPQETAVGGMGSGAGAGTSAGAETESGAGTKAGIKAGAGAGGQAGPAPAAKRIKIRVNGQIFTLSAHPAPIFVDVFNFVEIDPAAVRPGGPVCKLNGRPAAYTDSLQDGDEVEISF